MATRIPEGFVLVTPRSREVATALLEAVAAVRGDRVLDVRTVLNGYHVTEAVAQKYQESFPDAVVEDGEEEGTPEAESTQEATEAAEPEPLPVTADSTHAEIDAYAKSLDPRVDFPKDTNKADKIAILEAARAPKNDGAE